MRQRELESRHAADWESYRRLLAGLEGRSAGRKRPDGMQRFPALYRRLCGHYALAKARGYSPGLVATLHGLVQQGYGHLYRRRGPSPGAVLDFVARDFPSALRRHAGPFWVAAAALFLTMLAMGLASYHDEALIYSLMDEGQVADLETQYDPARAGPGGVPGREPEQDFAMFGFYVMNNLGVGFRCFATGLLLGLGSLLMLALNGLAIGAAAGHLTQAGAGPVFWPFVSGHAPFELTAIAISGAAGLLLGLALLAPRGRSRLAALRANAVEAVRLVAGAGVMLLVAAVIEAFWSPGPAPAEVKYAVGALGWVLVVAYLLLAGRGADLG